MRLHLKKSSQVSAAVALAVAAASANVFASARVYQPSNAADTWNSTANWSGTAIPGSSDTADFTNAGLSVHTVSGAVTVDTVASQTVQALRFGTGTGTAALTNTSIAINNNTITLNGITSNQNAIVYNANSTATVQINSNLILPSSVNFSIDGSAVVTVGGQIAGGNNTLTKTQGGILRLTNTGNVFSGGLVVSNGTVRFTDVAALGGGPITLGNAGAVNPNAGILGAQTTNETLNSSIAIRSGGGQINPSAGTNSLTVAGNITNSSNTNDDSLTIGGTNGGAITISGIINHGGALVKVGASTSTLTLTNTSNAYTGGTTINGGTVVIDSDAELGAAYDGTLSGVNVTKAGGGGTGSSPYTVAPAISITGGGSTGATATSTLSGGQVSTIGLGSVGGGYTSAPTVVFTDTSSPAATPVATAVALVKGLVTINGGTLQTAAGITSSRAIVLGSTGGTFDTQSFNSSLSGVINDGGTGTGALTKIGTGELTLTGNNTYGGTTTVSAGTLAVNGTNSGTGAVNVGDGTNAATLGGSGSIVGTVTIANNATIAPGNSPGNLTVGGLALNDGSQLSFDLDQANVVGPTGGNDLITVNGNLTLDGVLNVNSGADFGTGVYRLLNYTGTLTDNALQIASGLPTTYAYAIDSTTPGEVNLDVTTATPEPAMIGFLGISVTAMLRRRRMT